LAIYPKARRILRDEEELSLTNKEYDLLMFFIENPNIAFSKDTLFDRIWGMDAVGDTATVTVHVYRLREKIEPNVENSLIQTVWGIGYRFRLE
jgi:DNA-binding response OmpR family regulator